MDSLIKELREIMEELNSSVNSVNSNESISSLKNLENVAKEVQDSWSGSWIGYQSRVYYKDFEKPPAGDNFSSEWGLYTLGSRTDRSGWREYQYDEVADYIINRANYKGLEEAIEIAEKAIKLFNNKQKDTLSILETYLGRKKDRFVTENIEEIKSIKSYSKANLISAASPTQFSSRDSLAMSQGIQSPPHISILAEIFAIRSPIECCNVLCEKIRILISHITRQIGSEEKVEKKEMKIFIGHGDSPIWKDLKDFLKDRLKLDWDEFNRVPIAGISNSARLIQMLDNASFAFLIFTGEDEQSDGTKQARMNVVHEAGLFQGRLGFSKAIILLEEGCEEFSNIEGLGQIRFSKGNIKEVFEEIRRVLERERIITA